MIKRIWNSPTIMTWMSYSTKTVSIFIALPLILKRFSPGDIVLWYLFASIISLQSIADFGFRQTFSRIISYAFGGATDIERFTIKDKHSLQSTEPNNSLLTSIVSTMKKIYIWLTLIIFILMLIFGTWSLNKAVSDSSNISGSWWSWAIVLIVSCISFYGKMYMNFLEGLYQIALVRRIETLTSLAAILTSIVVLIISPTLLNLIIVNQFWVVVVTFRDWYLCRKVNNGLYKKISKAVPFDKVIFLKIWRPAWRSGISGFMSIGLTNLSGVIYAQVGDMGSVAAYLLALRIINQIRDISMAPFYSKLPLLAMLRVKGDLAELIRISKRGIFMSHMVFMIGFISVGLLSNELLKLMHSNISFVSANMWLLLGIAFFIHRYGAMHMQIYLSTNHIISHIADGVSGCLFIISSLILTHYIGIYAIPVGMLVGYLGFYAWYAAWYSYKSLNINFWSFEIKTSLIPISLLFTYIIFEAYVNHFTI